MGALHSTPGAAVLLLVGLLCGPPGAAVADPRLALVVDGQGRRLELVHAAGARGAALLLGPPLAARASGGLALGLDPLRGLPLVLEPVGQVRWDLPEGGLSPGLAAQVVLRGEGGSLRYSNVMRLGAQARAGRAEQSGEVVITEFMKDPVAVPDARGEWIELTSRLPYRIDLAGWVLRDEGSDFHRIEPGSRPLWLGAGERLVLGVEGDPARNGGVHVDHVLSNFVLANRGDAIHLHDRDGGLVDSVVYDAQRWPDRPGRSISYRLAVPDALANDLPQSWCSSSSFLPGGDRGTPGMPNDACPGQPAAAGGDDPR